MITTHNLDGSFGELELVFLSSSSHEASPVNHENVLQTLFRLVNEESCTCTIVMMTKSACWSDIFWRQPPFTRFYIWQQIKLIPYFDGDFWLIEFVLQVYIRYKRIWLIMGWLQISVSRKVNCYSFNTC